MRIVKKGQPITDIQVSVRSGRFLLTISPKRCVNGLSSCMERDLPMTATEKQAWISTKEKGLKLFAPKRGGGYEVHCMQDVQFLPRLWLHYRSKLTSKWAVKVEKATKERASLSQTRTFNGKGRHMALGQDTTTRFAYSYQTHAWPAEAVLFLTTSKVNASLSNATV